MITLPSKESIPDEKEDAPAEGLKLTRMQGGLPPLILGGGQFSNQYLSDEYLSGPAIVRVIRLALRYGINAFDTSIYYGPSELVIGNALQLVKDEFPRSSYYLSTKCGRFGEATFDYNPSAIRDSVKRSLERLQTDYLDSIYLHDIEFVANEVMPRRTGHHLRALGEEKAEYGLVEGEEAKIHGEGDQKVLDAYRELQKLKEEGVVKRIGITGYPLPTLLRIALLILHSPPFKPVDVAVSYSHLSVQNETLEAFLPHLTGRAKVGQVVTASPFSMGLLSSVVPPWHPAPAPLREAVTKAAERVRVDGQERLPAISLEHATRKCKELELPLVVGFSKIEEVHKGVDAWRRVVSGAVGEESVKGAEAARKVFEEGGFADWSWSSP